MPPGRSSGRDVAPAALVDCHAHFHDAFELDAFFDAARGNLDRAERELGLAGPVDDSGRPARVLLMMETSRPTLFERLDAATSCAWRASETGDAEARRFTRDGGPPIFVVEGRQVVTAERLELLATPCRHDLEAGRPIEDTIEEATRLGALSILPWGVGKWRRARGRRIAALLESHDLRGLLLADNGGRPALGGTPRLLSLGAQRGFRVVGGSDPLPMPGEVARVGSFGSLLVGPFDRASPASATRARLLAAVGRPRGFGTASGLVAFVARQLRWQLARRSRDRR